MWSCGCVSDIGDKGGHEYLTPFVVVDRKWPIFISINELWIFSITAINFPSDWINALTLTAYTTEFLVSLFCCSLPRFYSATQFFSFIFFRNAPVRKGSDVFVKSQTNWNRGIIFHLFIKPRRGVSTEALKDSVLCLRRGMKACKERRPGWRHHHHYLLVTDTPTNFSFNAYLPFKPTLFFELVQRWMMVRVKSSFRSNRLQCAPLWFWLMLLYFFSSDFSWNEKICCC